MSYVNDLQKNRESCGREHYTAKEMIIICENDTDFIDYVKKNQLSNLEYGKVSIYKRIDQIVIMPDP